MKIIETITEMRAAVRAVRAAGSLGLVPTMGALHAGHISLLRRARAENDTTAASIFVNPLQFAPGEDFARYPRTFADDCAQLEREGVDLLFAPTPGEMYSAGATSTIDPGPVGTRLDGAPRPGHFTGVATVVAKLFHIVQPDRAYFGQKDAAQLAILRCMVEDLNFPVAIIACPIVRDTDGLALSSRNRYLSLEERVRARVLSAVLFDLQARIGCGERQSSVLHAYGVKQLGRDNLTKDGPEVELDYLAIVDAATLLPVEVAVPGTLIAIAARIGQTRLIDNVIAP